MFDLNEKANEGTLDTLETAWRELPPDTQRQLAVRWCDHVVHTVFPDLYRRFDPGISQSIASTPPITDTNACAYAMGLVVGLTENLRAMGGGGGAQLLALAKNLSNEWTVRASCRLMLYASSAAYGDSRAALNMLTQIELAVLDGPPPR